MTQLFDRVRQSDFLNQVILDRTTTEELGRVEVLWMYVPKHRVLGFVGKSGLLGNKKFAFKLEQVNAVGEGGIVTQGTPEATTPDRVKRLESVMQHEVWTESGERLGKVIDCVFNLKTGEITHYLFVSSGISGILGEIYQVAPRWIGSIGEKRILLAATAAIDPYQDSLPQKISKTAETLKEEAVQEWRSIAQKATGQIQQIRSQVKERTQEVSERLREEAQTLAERAKEQSQTLAEQVKEQSQIISKQLEEGIQTLTIQAEEIFDRSDEPKTRQYSYEEEDFDWDWDELDAETSNAGTSNAGTSNAGTSNTEEPSVPDRNPKPQPTSSTPGSNPPGSNPPGSNPPGFNTFVDAEQFPEQDNLGAAQTATADSSGLIDGFDFDDDFWNDKPAPPSPRSPAPPSSSSKSIENSADPDENSADPDDEPWI